MEMSVPRPDPSDTPMVPDEGSVSATPEPDEVIAPQAKTGRPVPRTRLGAAWLGVCAAALTAAALIVFMLQNTRPVEVSFLWLQGTLPLGLALLIAGVGSVIVAIVFGIARMTQLRNLARRRRKD